MKNLQFLADSLILFLKRAGLFVFLKKSIFFLQEPFQSTGNSVLFKSLLSGDHNDYNG